MKPPITPRDCLFTRRRRPAPAGFRLPGFALVATLALVPIIAILALGLMGLSSIELRKASDHQAHLEARANARLALTLALGQLQEHLGPDQRVSADSRILEPAAPSTAASKLVHPHWVNVWRTTQPNGMAFIQRNAEDGGLRDLRTSGGWDAAAERIACLVSGNEERLRFFDGPSPALPGEREMVVVVGGGSVAPDDPEGRVRAPKVTLASGGKTTGAYAWWVGDLGIRANVSTPDASGGSTAKLAALRPLILSQDASILAFDAREELANEERVKMTSAGQIAIKTDVNGDSKRFYHDLTTDSLGVLVDVREGGLRKDLTAFLESGGRVGDLREKDTVSQGLQDRDKLVGPRNAAADAASPPRGQAARFSVVSPNFGLLRDWAGRARRATYEGFKTVADYAAVSPIEINSRNRAPAEFKNRVKSDLTPVLVEGSIYYNLSYYIPAGADARSPYGVRVHFYPRVALWNPYNFEITVDPSMINLHVNGSKVIEATLTNGARQSYRTNWGLGGAMRGSFFYKLNGAKIGPGETLVWSPLRNVAYDEGNFSNNVLSPTVAPSPSRSFYQDKRADGEALFAARQSGQVHDRLPALPRDWREIVPPRPGGNVQDGGYTQADDYLMIWKPLGGNTGAISASAFGRLQTGRFVSCAYQYGDEDEMPVEWSSLNPVPFPRSTLGAPMVPDLPDRRTRDGFRLRWFDEHLSNRIGSGSLARTPHLECSPIGTWNLRASYSLRNPFDNVTDVAPNFFGIYTRDLFDGAVDWNSMNPRLENGHYLGDPFGESAQLAVPRILFDIPRSGAEIASLGAFQHLSFSEFIWHPTYALGNSLADPRIELTRTEPRRSDRLNRSHGGWNQDTIGFALDGRSNPNGNTATTREDNWAYLARNLLQNAPIDQNLIYDLSYELNHSLWDTFFLSSGSRVERAAFAANPQAAPLPNGRLRLHPATGAAAGADDVLNFHRAAAVLALDGAFNVNSTSVKAWESMLLSSAGSQFGGEAVTFPRILGAPGGEWDGTDPKSEGAWTGQRAFTRGEIRRLAEEVVAEVKTRGPFLSLSDFVNRRLKDDATGKSGALQAAIDRAGLNDSFASEWPLDNTAQLPNYRHVDNIRNPTRLEQRHKPATTAWGALGFLTQADLLQFLGPALSARSDSFVIRAYGSSLGGNGELRAEAWCEAVIQRSPVPVAADDLGLNPRKNPAGKDFGRRFEITRFRWLSRDEV